MAPTSLPDPCIWCQTLRELVKKEDKNANQTEDIVTHNVSDTSQASVRKRQRRNNDGDHADDALHDTTTDGCSVAVVDNSDGNSGMKGRDDGDGTGTALDLFTHQQQEVDIQQEVQRTRPLREQCHWCGRNLITTVARNDNRKRHERCCSEKRARAEKLLPHHSVPYVLPRRIIASSNYVPGQEASVTCSLAQHNAAEFTAVKPDYRQKVRMTEKSYGRLKGSQLSVVKLAQEKAIYGERLFRLPALTTKNKLDDDKTFSPGVLQPEGTISLLAKVIQGLTALAKVWIATVSVREAGTWIVVVEVLAWKVQDGLNFIVMDVEDLEKFESDRCRDGWYYWPM